MRLRIIALLGQTNSTSMSDLPKGKHERCCAAIPPEYLKFHQLRSGQAARSSETSKISNVKSQASVEKTWNNQIFIDMFPV
jgi:hypothetical protein